MVIADVSGKAVSAALVMARFGMAVRLLANQASTPLDLLADRMTLPVAQEGDLAVVFQSGAYGASASPQAFLGHAPCLEVLV